MYRKKMATPQSKKLFTRTASKTHVKNIKTMTVNRGGIRL